MKSTLPIFYILYYIFLLIPAQNLGKSYPFLDIIIHFLIFFFLTILSAPYFKKKGLFILLLLLAITGEYAQSLLSYRDFSILDISMDILGILGGYFIFHFFVHETRTLFKIISSCIGIGYIPCGGTWISLIVLFLFFIFSLTPLTAILLILNFILLTIYSSPYTGDKDPSFIVIDEAAGMTLVLLFLPYSILLYFLGFVLFRFFDIFKPLGIRSTEFFPWKIGVLIDDLLAGAYTIILIRGLLFLRELLLQRGLL